MAILAFHLFDARDDRLLTRSVPDEIGLGTNDVPPYFRDLHVSSGVCSAIEQGAAKI